MVPIKNWRENAALGWDPLLELGHDIIDAEHCILHKLIVDFESAANQDASKDELIRILKEIIAYAEFHFASEEKIMADYQYPELKEHATFHSTLLAEVRDKCVELQQDKIESAQLYAFLLNWFAFHTSHEDKKLVRFIKG